MAHTVTYNIHLLFVLSTAHSDFVW